MLKPRIYILQNETTLPISSPDTRFDWFVYKRARDVLCELKDNSHNEIIVCIDISIRDMDWRIVLDQIYRHSFSINCILLDKNYNVHTAIESAKLGAMDYLPYPIDSGCIISRIDLIRDYPLSRKKCKDMFLSDNVFDPDEKDCLEKLVSVKLESTSTCLKSSESFCTSSKYTDFYSHLIAACPLEKITLRDILNEIEFYLGVSFKQLEKPALLIVEDELSVLESMTFVLSDYFDVYSAINAKEAIDILNSEESISLITIDYKLPDMTGSEFFEWCQINCPEVPSVFVTATHDPDLALSMIKNGSIDYVTKPFERYDLINALSRALCRSIWPYFEDKLDIHDLSYIQRAAFLSYDLIRMEQTQSIVHTGRLLALFPELSRI